jgi:hypothetical protein
MLPATSLSWVAPTSEGNLPKRDTMPRIAYYGNNKSWRPQPGLPAKILIIVGVVD